MTEDGPGEVRKGLESLAGNLLGMEDEPSLDFNSRGTASESIRREQDWGQGHPVGLRLQSNRNMR